jgi:hypothetical protein
VVSLFPRQRAHRVPGGQYKGLGAQAFTHRVGFSQKVPIPAARRLFASHAVVASDVGIKVKF